MMYAINRLNGGVTILQVFTDADPAGEVARWPKDEQDAVIVSSIRPVNLADIPTDRTFRDAWRPDFSCDMAKARDIWRARMRKARKPKLAASDIEYTIADEAGDNPGKRLIAAKRQELRDVTKHPDIEKAKTPDELKKVWPDCLKV